MKMDLNICCFIDFHPKFVILQLKIRENSRMSESSRILELSKQKPQNSTLRRLRFKKLVQRAKFRKFPDSRKLPQTGEGEC